MPRAHSPSASAPAPSALTDQEQFDLRCIRYRHAELARMGCGAADCVPDACAIARHARLVVRALDVLAAAAAAAEAVPRASAYAPKRLA